MSLLLDKFTDKSYSWKFKNIVFELVLFHREVMLLESMYFMSHAIVQSMINYLSIQSSLSSQLTQAYFSQKLKLVILMIYNIPTPKIYRV